MDVSLSLKQRLQLEVYRLHRHNEARLHELRYILWECTLRCNLSCRHCGSDCAKDAAVPDMPLEDFLAVLRQVAADRDPSRVMVGISGGEPLLRADLEAAGRAIRELGFPWGIVTNALALDAKRFDSLLAAGLGSLAISLDGMEDAHTHLRRNPRSFGMALDAIGRAAKVPHLYFDVITCVHQRTFPQLEQLKKQLIAQGLKRWRLYTIFPRGRAEGAEDLSLSPKQFRELLDFIRRTREEGLIRVEYACEGFLGGFEGQVRDLPFSCLAGVNYASVLCDGSISGCPSIRGGFVQGSIYERNFLDVWETEFGMMRDRNWTKTGKCARCRMYRYCEGNGLHLHRAPGDEPSVCHWERIVEGAGQ